MASKKSSKILVKMPHNGLKKIAQNVADKGGHIPLWCLPLQVEMLSAGL
jgi:hypothetical protein